MKTQATRKKRKGKTGVCVCVCAAKVKRVIAILSRFTLTFRCASHFLFLSHHSHPIASVSCYFNMYPSYFRIYLESNESGGISKMTIIDIISSSVATFVFVRRFFFSCVCLF